MGITFFGYDVNRSNAVCEQPSTESPIAAYKTAPTQSPTTDAPPPSPVEESTVAEDDLSSSLIILQSEIKIRVSPVSGDLVTTFELARGFESACSKFFSMHSPNTIRDVNCVIVKQALTLPRGGRSLQHQKRSLRLDEMILDSTVLVSAVPAAEGYFQKDFEAALIPLLNENSDDFAAQLKSWTHFSKVDTIQGYDSTQEFPDLSSVAAPTPSPVDVAGESTEDTSKDTSIEDTSIEDTNTGFFTDTVIIVLLVVGGLLIAVFLCYYMKKRGTRKELPPEAPREIYF